MARLSRAARGGIVGLVACAQTSPVGARCREADSRIGHSGSFGFMHYLWTPGGARIGWLRTRISMTIIGAPQCRQTNVGAVVLGDASSLASMAAGACNSARIVARFCRRTGLASRP